MHMNPYLHHTLSYYVFLGIHSGQNTALTNFPKTFKVIYKPKAKPRKIEKQNKNLYNHIINLKS
jgi:hypothetical protein